MGISCLSCVVKPCAPANEDAQRRRCPKASKCGSRTKDHNGISEAPNGRNIKRRIQSIPTPPQPVATTEIHANHLEAFHTSLRRRCAAYRRRTNMYAKKTGRLQERLDVYWIVHNFVRVHFTTRQVPAVALGILDHGFALHELFLRRQRIIPAGVNAVQ